MSRRPLDPILRLGAPLFQAARTSMVGWPSAVGECGYRAAGGSLGSLAELFALPLVGVAHLLVDGFAGVVGGAAFGTPLTDDEKHFAVSIYGNRIPLNAIRIVETGWGYNGMAAATTIYLGRRNLDDPVSRGTFAHELAHVYQDSRWRNCHRGTLRATWQAFVNASKIRDVYRLDLDTMTQWRRLEPESQAVVVECWIEAKAFAALRPCFQRDALEYYLGCRNVDANNPDDIAKIERLLVQSGLFGGDPAAWNG